MTGNTIILAAGDTDYENMSQGLTKSKLLSIVNGRPVISWVISNILKDNSECVYVVTNRDDDDLNNFLQRKYVKNRAIRLIKIRKTNNIMETLDEAFGEIETNGALNINLGDTLVLENNSESRENNFYISDFDFDSKSWCVFDSHLLNSEKYIFLNKVSNLESSRYKALVGRYCFSNGSLVKEITKTLIKNRCENLSDIILEYSKINKCTPLHIDNNKWIDFGNLEGISKAKKKLMESRAFNTLELSSDRPLITKKSTNKEKLFQEYNWYSRLPNELAAFAPRIFKYDKNKNTDSMLMEYYGYGTLAEKYIFFDLSMNFWRSALSKMFDVVNIFKLESKKIESKGNVDYVNFYKNKTLGRLEFINKTDPLIKDFISKEKFLVNNNSIYGLDYFMDEILDSIKRIIDSATTNIVHGDLCFNNILYDIQSGIVKLIDPRGECGTGSPSIYGDPRYDIAKLRHSFCGNYDVIIEGDYHFYEDDNGYFFTVFKDKQEERERIFDELCISYGYDCHEIKFIEALLFLTMLPLHSDSINRQKAFFMNALIKFNRIFMEKL